MAVDATTPVGLAASLPTPNLLAPYPKMPSAVLLNALIWAALPPETLSLSPPHTPCLTFQTQFWGPPSKKPPQYHCAKGILPCGVSSGPRPSKRCPVGWGWGEAFRSPPGYTQGWGTCPAQPGARWHRPKSCPHTGNKDPLHPRAAWTQAVPLCGLSCRSLFRPATLSYSCPRQGVWCWSPRLRPARRQQLGVGVQIRESLYL